MNYKINAPAKINLSLDVVSKRADGYHNLESVMHTVPLFDELEFSETSASDLKITSDKPGLCTDKKNIVYKVYDAFYKTLGKTPSGFSVFIKKRIPDAAGLAGGSSDGAATLKFLNEYHGFPFSSEELEIIGSRTGADIPFLVRGGCCFCEGIGEILTEKPLLPPCKIIIAKPYANGLSTPEIFSELDISKIEHHPDNTALSNALFSGSIEKISSLMYNVLEEVSSKKCPEIKDIEKAMRDNHALNAIMSGSGNSVFGIFRKDCDTADAINSLKNLKTELFIYEMSL